MDQAVRDSDVGSFVAELVAIIGKRPAVDFLYKAITALQESARESDFISRTEEHKSEATDIISLTRSNSIISFEVLDSVFTYLDYPSLCKASEVCKAWHNLALDPTFWSSFGPSPRMSIPPLYAPHVELSSLIHLPRFYFLHKIDLSPWKNEVDGEWVANNLTHLQKLRHISLHECKRTTFTTPGLTRLISLTSIDLSTTALGNLVSNESLAIVQKLTNLVRINLFYCEKINDYGLHHLVTLPKLQHLDLGNCYRLTSFGVSVLSPLASTLISLSLKSITRSNFSIDDDGLKSLSAFSKLTSLDVGYCKRITDKGMSYLSHLQSLTHIGLADTMVTDEGITGLRRLSNLKSLDIADCRMLTTAAPKLVSFYFPSLRSISLKGIPFGKHSMWNLAGLKVFNHLEELDFTNTYISDEMMVQEHCKAGIALKTLNLSYCTDITDLSIYNVCTSMPQLRHLYLTHCHSLTDKALEHLEYATNLSIVDLSGIYSLTQNGLHRLHKNRPDLKVVK